MCGSEFEHSGVSKVQLCKAQTFCTFLARSLLLFLECGIRRSWQTRTGDPESVVSTCSLRAVCRSWVSQLLKLCSFLWWHGQTALLAVLPHKVWKGRTWHTAFSSKKWHVLQISDQEHQWTQETWSSERSQLRDGWRSTSMEIISEEPSVVTALFCGTKGTLKCGA